MIDKEIRFEYKWKSFKQALIHTVYICRQKMDKLFIRYLNWFVHFFAKRRW